MLNSIFNFSVDFLTFFTHLLYTIYRVCYKCTCICSINTGPWMSYAQWRNAYILSDHLGVILIVVLGIYSDLSGRVRTVYIFSLCVISLTWILLTIRVLNEATCCMSQHTPSYKAWQLSLFSRNTELNVFDVRVAVLTTVAMNRTVNWLENLKTVIHYKP